jgi:hypothetical protein
VAGAVNENNLTTGAARMTKRVRRAALLAGAGIAIQLVAALHWTPATFIVSAVVAAPLVLAGGLLFLVAVWKNLRRTGAL